MQCRALFPLGASWAPCVQMCLQGRSLHHTYVAARCGCEVDFTNTREEILDAVWGHHEQGVRRRGLEEDLQRIVVTVYTAGGASITYFTIDVER